MNVKIILLILAAIVVTTVVFDYFQTKRLIAIGVAQTEATKAYERRLPEAQQHFLIVGDSSAVGVGAEPPQGSIAGRLAADFPAADVQNIAVSGSRVTDAIKQLESLPSDSEYDLIIIQIGGNDIVHRTPLRELERNVPLLLNLAKEHSDHVIQLTSGNVGTSKLLPFGTRWYYTLRTKEVRAIFMSANTTAHTTYIDLYRPRSKDPYAQNPEKYYSPDFFHPSADGYGDWYSFLKRSL